MFVLSTFTRIGQLQDVVLSLDVRWGCVQLLVVQHAGLHA